MFSFLHQLFSNFVHQLFGTGQVVHSGFIRAHLLETLRLKHSKCALKLKLGAKRDKKLCRAAKLVIILSGFVTISDPSHITHHHLIHCLYKNVIPL